MDSFHLQSQTLTLLLLGKKQKQKQTFLKFLQVAFGEKNALRKLNLSASIFSFPSFRSLPTPPTPTTCHPSAQTQEGKDA